MKDRDQTKDSEAGEDTREDRGSGKSESEGKGGESKGVETRSMSRRELLVRVGGVTLASGALSAAAWWRHSFDPLARAEGAAARGPVSFVVPPPAGRPRVVWVKGGDVEARMERALRELGGLGHFIQPKDRVLIKPNMAWDKAPRYGANTGPEVMEAMIKRCLDLGAKVVVAENPVNDGKLCAESTGIGAVCKRQGVPLVLPRKEDFVDAQLEGKALKRWPVMKLLYEVDKIIDLPIPKHHRLSRVTCALKNWIGIAGGRRMKLHQNIHDTICDLVAAFPPTLVYVDASKILMRHGPTGGRVADVKTSDVAVAGVDPATVDAAVLPLLDAPLTEARHITEAVVRGLGTTDMGKVHRVNLVTQG